MIKLVLITLAAMTLVACGSDTPSTTTSNYTNCINSPETQANAGIYRMKYPQLSLSQIKHSLCKNQ